MLIGLEDCGRYVWLRSGDKIMIVTVREHAGHCVEVENHRRYDSQGFYQSSKFPCMEDIVGFVDETERPPKGNFEVTYTMSFDRVMSVNSQEDAEALVKWFLPYSSVKECGWKEVVNEDLADN